MHVVLDTMVWSYVAERQERDALEALEDNYDLKLVVPPSILLEVLRTPIPDLRASIVAAMAARGKTRVHPLPEVKQEADELLSALRKYRADLLRQFPHTDSLPALETFWTRKLWQRARSQPDEMARLAKIHANADADAEKILEHQRTLKTAIGSDAQYFRDSAPSAKFDDRSGDLRQGWDGKPVEAWRVESTEYWWYQLVVIPRRASQTGSDTSAADWIGPSVMLKAVGKERASWNRLWYYEIEPVEAPRNWMRSTLPFAQVATKIGAGNPRDAQHSAYLFDADAFVTADRHYVKTLELLRRWAPVPFAKTILISAKSSTVSAIQQGLSLC